MYLVTDPAILAGSPLLYVLLTVIGLAVSTYSTMVGIGGGVILLPILLLLFPDTPPEVLTSISLIVILLNAFSGTIAYTRQGRIDFRSGALFALATIPGIVIGVWLLRSLEIKTFSIIFGVLLLAVSVLIISRPQIKSPDSIGSHAAENKGRANPNYLARRTLGTALNFIAGIIAGLLGIGGGIIHVPMMVYVLRFPVRIATATSHFILIFTTITGIITHLVLNMWSGDWHVIACLALGIIPGAQLGAFLSRRLQSTIIIRLLALALIVLGIRMIF